MSDKAKHFEIVWKLHALGFSVIPSGGGDSHKSPLVDWKEYQERQPTDLEIQDWQERWSPELWGIVTGSKSCLVVTDADRAEAKDELEKELGSPFVISPRGGAHWYFKHPGHHIKTATQVITGVDIRGDGGFVNIVGSRPDGEYIILKLPTPDTILPWAVMPERIKKALNGTKPQMQQIRSIIPEGQRNATLASLAGTMRRRSMSQSTIETALLVVNQEQCKPPLSEDEVKRIAASVSRYPPYNDLNNIYIYDPSGQNISEAKGDKNGTHVGTTSLQKEARDLSRFEGLSKKVRAWVENTNGWFETRELDLDLGISETKDKENRKKILQRLHEQGIIEPHQKLNRQWRYINKRVASLLFKTAKDEGVLPVKWPMGIEKYVNLFPGNEVVVAGSPNAGKTAFLLNFIQMNQDTFAIYYLCSEMGDVELRNRLEQFPGMAIEDWKFEAIERASDFADVIRPDCLNIIDYLEMTDELYAVNTHLTEISHKLGSGVAIIALQKKEGAKFGRGQEFGMEKPKLYLSMDRGKLQIIKGKSWANKKVDPCGLEVCFKIVGGCQFEITKNWDWKR